MHFYDSEGKSAHEIVGANGNLRPTTIRDARKLHLYPSVTTILDIENKPFLTQWLLNEMADACMSTPYHPHEFEADKYKAMLFSLTRKKARNAAERGTEIHNKLDNYFTTGKICRKDKKYIMPAIECLKDTFPNHTFISEKSFISEYYGFGGCVDLHALGDENDCPLVIDFKTKDKESLDKVEQYDSHKMQLAAYQIGLQLPMNTRRFNLFVSTNTPGVKLVEATEFDKYFQMFYNLLRFWTLRNNYDPSNETDKYY